MKVINQLKLIFILVLVTLFGGSGVFSDDLVCLQSLLLTLFNVPVSQTNELCALGSSRQVDLPDYFYKITCDYNVANTITQLEIISQSKSSVNLAYNNLNCFSVLLSEVIFTNLKFSVNAFGSALSEKAVASRLFLTNCVFDQRLVAVGGSLPSGTSLLDLTIDNNSNFLYMDFDSVKKTKYLKIVTSNDLIVYPQYTNTIDSNQASTIDFFHIIIETTSVPLFNNIKCGNLYLGLVNAQSISNWGNLDSITSIDSLFLCFDSDIVYPTVLQYLSIKKLSLGGTVLSKPIGKLKAPLSLLDLPPSLEFLSILDSPQFNINGQLPFALLPTTLKEFVMGNLALTTFPNLPSGLQILTIGNNNFASNGPVSLPDLSQYGMLKIISLQNCGFSNSIPDSYSIFELYLNDNQLSGLWPAWAVCYKEDYQESFGGNPNLVQGSCLKGSIVPNVIEYVQSTGALLLTGKNLGYYDPQIVNPALSFMTNVRHSSYSATWDSSNFGPLPETLDIAFGYNILTVPTKILTPSIQNITKSGTKYTFNGRNFSYVKFDITVKVANVKATITYIDFHSIELEFSEPLPLGQDIAATIVNEVNPSNIVKFTINTIQDKTTTLLPCDLDCNYDLGYGICSSTLGRCVCSTPYYDGTQCKDISQFLSSASSTNTQGGVVNLYGWFGATNSNFNVKIGSQDCIVLDHYKNTTFANCTIGPGSGTQSITVSQNGRSYTAKDMFHYTELTYKCPKDCTLNGIQNGICNKTIGQCKCYQGWGGYDCGSKTSTVDIPSSSGSTTTTTTTTSTTTSGSSYETPAPTLSPIEIPKSNTTINNTVGSAIINNQQTTYEISIVSLVEFDINNDVVQTHNLTNQWTLSTNNNNSDNQYVFKQTILQTCTIIYTIEDIKVPRDIEFAGLTLTLDIGIKITVTIEDYPFTSSLNSLQLRLESSVGENNSTKELNNECNNKETQVDSSQIDKDQLLNYIVISRNEKTLYGRFLNKALSDSRSTFITTSFISNSSSLDDNNKQNFIYGLNLPFFTKSLTIDPDFSVLVSSSFKKCKSSDNQEKDRPSWVLPVAIVVPCVAVACAIIVGAIIYQKNRTNILLAKERYKFSLKSLSKKNMDSLYMEKS